MKPQRVHHGSRRPVAKSADTLREFEEVLRRRVKTVEEALEEAAPRFKAMGWKVTEGKQG